ncbi:MAG: T9SS type A sorting domain-containing protein [Verrucomicrobiota bacterium]|nr:T9SS type A sorting domain-containing protein [Verrucomicrobiota bacterium]
MNYLRLPFVLSLLCASASVVFAGSAPINVVVSDAAGKVAYKGVVGGDGAFATPKLPAGNYVVQFNAAEIRGDQAVVVSAGKKKVSAAAVSATQFRSGGVAMRIEVGANLNIAGQVAPAVTGLVAPSTERSRAASVDTVRRIQDQSGQGAVLVGPKTPGAGGR